MSWRFRQSFKIIPGLKLNLSKTGLSASIGGAPFTVNLGPRGLYGTASIPGTGISFKQRLSDGPHSHSTPTPYAPIPLPDVADPKYFPASSPSERDYGLPQLREIRSASTELLTSQSLQELKSLIKTAYEQHEQITDELSKATQEDVRANRRFKSWESGFLLRNIFKKSFEVRKAQAEIASARKCELEEQLRLTKIATQVELEREQAEPFFKMRDDFTALADCNVIWDVKAERSTDKVRERTISSTNVDREPVTFSLAICDLIQWEQEVPRFKNVNGGDIYLYPGFILYRASKTAFSVIDFHDVNLTVTSVRFTERENIPSDSEIIGQTWAKTNKDGSRDRRFAGNHQIPIAHYGELTLKSETGLWEKFMFSNPGKLDQFVKSWKAFVASFNHKVSLVFTEDQSGPPISEPEPIKIPAIAGAKIHFECNSCHQPIEVNVEAVGQEFSCPSCGTRIVVPEQA